MHNFINISNKFKVKVFKTVNFYTVNTLYIYILVLNFVLIANFFLV